MSYLDVKVLRNFTKKLASAATNKYQAKWDKTFDVDRSAAPAATGSKISGPEVVNSAVPQQSGEEIVLPPAADKAAPVSNTPSTPAGYKPLLNQKDTRVGSAETGKELSLPGQDGSGADTAAAGGGFDWNSLAPYAAPVAGGLGAIGLANLFRSKNDEDEGGGLLSNLMYGAGGAGLGYAAYKYLPGLIAQLMSRAGTTPLPPGNADDLSSTNPAAGEAQLQTTSPVNAATQV